MKDKIIQRIKYLYKNVQGFSAQNKRKTAAILCIAAVFMLFLSGFLVGRFAFSKQYTLNNFGSALNNKSYSKIRRYCVLEDDIKISKKEIAPFVEYFSSKDRVDSLIDSLKNTGKYSNFIELKNRKFLIFNNYYISIKKIKVKFKVNFAQTKLYLNDSQKYVTKDDNEIVTINDIIPGVYDLKAINKNEFDEISLEKQITAVNSNSNFNIELNGTKVSLNTEYPDADVFINGSKVNVTADEFVDKGPFNVDKENEIYIEQTFPWGKIRSDSVRISSSPVIHIKLKLNNKKLDDILNDTVQECVKSLFDAMNAEDINMIKAQNKEKIYNEFVAERKLLRNQYELSQYDFKINESEVIKKDNTYYANIYTTLKYSISKKLFGFELSSEDREKRVFFKIEMNKDESWNVVDIYVIK